jgi:hypothetical protein
MAVVAITTEQLQHVQRVCMEMRTQVDAGPHCALTTLLQQEGSAAWHGCFQSSCGAVVFRSASSAQCHSHPCSRATSAGCLLLHFEVSQHFFAVLHCAIAATGQELWSQWSHQVDTPAQRGHVSAAEGGRVVQVSVLLAM